MVQGLAASLSLTKRVDLLVVQPQSLIHFVKDVHLSSLCPLGWGLDDAQKGLWSIYLNE